MTYGSTQATILGLLGDRKPRGSAEIVKDTSLSESAVGNGLRRLWRKNSVLRSEKPVTEMGRVFKGRAGVSSNLRRYYLYILKPEGRTSLAYGGHRFVAYKKKYLDSRGINESKSKLILDFLKDGCSQAFFSKEIAEKLKENGVKPSDIMSTVRRYEKKGLIYVRGYRTHDKQTPFKDGFLLTWIAPNKSREKAIEEAIQRTNNALAHRSASSPVIERIRNVRDIILQSTKLKNLVSTDFIKNKLSCSDYELRTAVNRVLQLYPDIKEVKLFNNFRYLYHTSMPEEELNASIEMTKNYIRKAKGKANRVGHNWEAVAEWFIDKFTTGATFRMQKHRKNIMDPRRITLHLLRGVRGRKYNAEVDRVWQVTPGVFAKPITYVLECKWGVVRKAHVDDFLEVLKWSMDFGVDTPEGRQVKQGVIGVFAGSAFNPKENVRLKNDTVISLAQYTSRMNIQLLKASDFNEKLRDRGCHKRVTVQKICRVSKDEKEVREILEKIWESPKKSDEIISKALEKNMRVFDFEKMLEEESSR